MKSVYSARYEQFIISIEYSSMSSLSFQLNMYSEYVRTCSLCKQYSWQTSEKLFNAPRDLQHETSNVGSPTKLRETHPRPVTLEYDTPCPVITALRERERETTCDCSGSWFGTRSCSVVWHFDSTRVGCACWAPIRARLGITERSEA